MWNKVGIFRNEDGITEALKEIDQLIEDYKTCYVGDPERTFTTWHSLTIVKSVPC